MRSIVPDLTDELLSHFGNTNRVGLVDAFPVNTFSELVKHTAKLSFGNKDHCLFYRGQHEDYRNKAGSSTFYPSIYRGDYVQLHELNNKFDILEGASGALVDLFEEHEIDGCKELKRRKAIQWSILQHYEVCETPYLDFTQSLRVACSFATLDNPNDKAYVFVFGMPYQTNRISINSEHDIINIRLLSICPPTAYRPYYQEGYLIGTDDITTNYDTKNELDFNNRLIAKFEIPNDKTFWGGGFHKIPKSSLYPDNDPILELCQQIQDIADRELKSGDLGEFLKSWAQLEEYLITSARNQTRRLIGVSEATRILYQQQLIPEEILYRLNQLRKFRNTLVHHPKEITPAEVTEYLESLDHLKRTLKIPKRRQQ